MSQWPSEVKLPTWVSSGAAPTRGVDILALRAVVQGVGGELLDGITTVTPTVRYLGLRTWLARRYALARLPATPEAFSDFAGRIEAAVTIGNLLVKPSTQGMVGSNEALVALAGEPAAFDVGTLVGQTAADIYAGPSDQLGLSLPSEGAVPELTRERGLPLFDAVECTLGRTQLGEQLTKDPKVHHFTREVLREVGERFAMGSPDEGERVALLAALLPSQPRPTDINRLGSYALILELAQRLGRAPRKGEVYALALSHESNLPDLYSPWLDGWTRYLLRDMLAVVHEAALESLVGEVARQGRAGAVEGAAVIAQLLSREDEVEDALAQLGVLPEGGRPLDVELPILQERIRAVAGVRKEGAIRRWPGPIDEEALIAQARSGGAGVLALLPLAWLLVAERVGRTGGRGLGERGMSRQGRERLGVEQVVLPEVGRFLSQRRSVREVAVELAWRTVEQHLSTAWSRLAARPHADVSCLIADGTRWSLQSGFRHGRTTDRVSRAIGWTQQLGLVSGEGLTAEGHAVLCRLREQLTTIGGDA